MQIYAKKFDNFSLSNWMSEEAEIFTGALLESSECPQKISR